MLRGGWNLSGDKSGMVLKKGDRSVKFDIVIPTPKGSIYCMYFKRDAEVTGVAAGKPKKLPIMALHKMLGHPDEEKTRETANFLGIEIECGGMCPCGACTAAKVKQKNMPKTSEHVICTKCAERIFLDIASVKKPKMVQKTTSPTGI